MTAYELVAWLCAAYLIITLAVAARATLRAENRRINQLIADFDRDHPRQQP